jgi:hypothetical protein
MKRPQPSMGGFPESNERCIQQQQAEVLAAWEEASKEQLFLDSLLEMGFTLEEANKLVDLREHLWDNAEMRQRMANDYRMHFARWLYEQGEIREQE